MPRLFCDIDNTLIRTEVALIKYPYWSRLRIGIARNRGIIKYVKDKQRDGYSLIFITHRRSILFFATYIDLVLMGFLGYKLIMVKNPKHKLFYLKRDESTKTIYIDDLSFNGESGNRLFYSDIIKEISSMTIIYKGYEWIQKNK